MPIKVLMPALSPTMTEGKLAKWLVKEGDTVESGDVMAEIETDKATMEVEAVDEGTLGKILVAEGTDNVAVNSVIAMLLEEGEDASALEGADTSDAAPPPAAEEPNEAAPAPEKKAEPAPTPASPPPAAAPAASSGGGRIFASPLAKRLAKMEGLDLGQISGSGPHGRIVKRDIEQALASGTGKAAPAAAPTAAGEAAAVPPAGIDEGMLGLLPEYEAVPNTGMRKTIAKRLTASARDIPHFNVTADIEIDKLLGLRKELNGREGADYKISVNDFVIKAVALALKRQPDCNVAYTDDAILKFNRADISMAVAVDGGLITPIIKDAGSKGLAKISEEAKELAGKARDGKLQPQEYQGGTFSISNLGMFGVKSFNSIINAPQGGILSVGAGEQRAVVKDGALAVATLMSVTLAVDHRCIDGATAAAFVKELKGILEDPLQLML
ncbi:MAG: pyruvate dehydrogenase complex dihydrolipoamide acetyltransferase [Rhodospirillales bacterium]|nr:pyruvate dehydrogenase complex dihydrolipoamide acetyltransferase [Rhodospirillales bacterium]MBO6786643.1 pyruvate dehydrogenase complex dihydrolipoamide acetyltransferase [Rhodospirillales bacterium]